MHSFGIQKQENDFQIQFVNFFFFSVIYSIKQNIVINKNKIITRELVCTGYPVSANISVSGASLVITHGYLPINKSEKHNQVTGILSYSPQTLC